MSLADGQFSYRDLLWGAGTSYYMQELDGLEGMPEVRQNDSELPRGHGAVPGKHYAGKRQVVAKMVVVDPPATGGETLGDGTLGDGTLGGGGVVALHSHRRLLMRAFQVQVDAEHALAFKRPGMPERMVFARPVALPIVETVGTVDRVDTVNVAFSCADPRLYSVEQQTATVPVYTTTLSGVDDPVEDPKEGGAGSQSDAYVTNGGDTEAWPLIRFYGPPTGSVTTVRLRNRTTGELLEVVTSIVAGQILTVDFQVSGRVLPAGRVVDLDGASRYGSWTAPRTPLGLVPGENTLRFETVGDAGAKCVVVWRDTWLG